MIGHHDLWRQLNFFFFLKKIEKVPRHIEYGRGCAAINGVLGTEGEDEEEMNEPMLRSNSRNGLNSPGS